MDRIDILVVTTEPTIAHGIAKSCAMTETRTLPGGISVAQSATQSWGLLVAPSNEGACEQVVSLVLSRVRPAWVVHAEHAIEQDEASRTALLILAADLFLVDEDPRDPLGPERRSRADHAMTALAVQVAFRRGTAAYSDRRHATNAVATVTSGLGVVRAAARSNVLALGVYAVDRYWSPLHTVGKDDAMAAQARVALAKSMPALLARLPGREDRPAPEQAGVVAAQRVTSLRVRNIRSLPALDWSPPSGPEGWHVILGDNASGKTTVARSFALGLLSQDDLRVTRIPPARWLRHGAEDGEILVGVQLTWPQGASLKEKSASRGHEFRRTESAVVSGVHPAATNGPQGFLAGFGPFRRFSGSDRDERDLARDFPTVGRLITLLFERASLEDTVSWLQKLKAASNEDKPHATQMLEQVIRFVNQPEFFPHGERLDLAHITSDRVALIDAHGAVIDLDEMSDGFRSVLSLTLELFRQMAEYFGADDLTDTEGDAVVVRGMGVVIIDEVDVHLHPAWQQSVGFWLRKHFPGVQFIVTTHSPLVCRAVAHGGSVFRLPTPGTGEEPGFIEGVALQRLIYGNVVEAYGTGAWGHDDPSRSPLGHERLQRLAVLLRKEHTDHLTHEEQGERDELLTIFPMGPEEA